MVSNMVIGHNYLPNSKFMSDGFGVNGFDLRYWDVVLPGRGKNSLLQPAAK